MKGKPNTQHIKKDATKFITTSICVSPEQYKFVKREGLRMSWILQDGINQRMTEKVGDSLDMLLEDGYLTVSEYRKIVRKFEERREKEAEKLTDGVLKRELAELKRIRTKIDREIEWREIQKGDRKPEKKDFYKFNINKKL